MQLVLLSYTEEFHMLEGTSFTLKHWQWSLLPKLLNKCPLTEHFTISIIKHILIHLYNLNIASGNTFGVL